MEALVTGLTELVPLRFLSKFDAQEVEWVIAGTPEINVDDWRKHTEYTGGDTVEGGIIWKFSLYTVYIMKHAWYRAREGGIIWNFIRNCMHGNRGHYMELYAWKQGALYVIVCMEAGGIIWNCMHGNRGHYMKLYAWKQGALYGILCTGHTWYGEAVH